jgi:hypothetical protein
MFQFLLKIFFLGAVAVGAVVAFIHVFPYLMIILAIIGLAKLWQVIRGPKPPPGWRR